MRRLPVTPRTRPRSRLALTAPAGRAPIRQARFLLVQLGVHRGHGEVTLGQLVGEEVDLGTSWHDGLRGKRREKHSGERASVPGVRAQGRGLKTVSYRGNRVSGDRCT
jgi:hypothetical protein